MNHLLADDVTANLQVSLPVLLCRRNHKDSFCHGNAVRCRGLCNAGDSSSSFFIFANTDKKLSVKAGYKVPHSVSG